MSCVCVHVSVTTCFFLSSKRHTGCMQVTFFFCAFTHRCRWVMLAARSREPRAPPDEAESHSTMDKTRSRSWERARPYTMPKDKKLVKQCVRGSVTCEALCVMYWRFCNLDGWLQPYTKPKDKKLVKHCARGSVTCEALCVMYWRFCNLDGWLQPYTKPKDKKLVKHCARGSVTCETLFVMDWRFCNLDG